MKSITPYCGNCGNYGHSYRKCLAPIISLGVILFKKSDDGYKYLMIQRRDTLGFVEFIRGKYNLENIKYIIKLFEIMTETERENIMNNNFDTLWNNLWMSKNNQYHNEYDNSKKKFNLLKMGIYIKNALYSLDKINKTANKIYKSPEWGFPKGRRNCRETDLDCAKREFEEESGMESANYKILSDIKPIEEIFSGTNNIRYKHIYYVAVLLEDKELTIDKDNFNQASEISNIKWFDFENVLANIREYNIEKKNVITKVKNIITKNNL